MNKQILRNLNWQKSFWVAMQGFATALKNEKSVRRALFFAAFFIVLTLLIHSHYLEVLIIVITWTQVVVLEMFNTAMEKVLDYTSHMEYHPLVKKAKDFSAASVFIAALVGVLIFAMIAWNNFIVKT